MIVKDTFAEIEGLITQQFFARMERVDTLGRDLTPAEEAVITASELADFAAVGWTEEDVNAALEAEREEFYATLYAQGAPVNPYPALHMDGIEPEPEVL